MARNMIRTGPNPMDSQQKLTNMSEKRLGLCEACNVSAAQYTCPRCEVKTCSLVCLKLHKQELKCDGIRDRTKYIPLVKMTRVDLMNDYYFLEECTKFVQDRKRDFRKRYTCTNKHLPNHMVRLQRAALSRGTRLKFLLQHFSKRQKNTTYLDFKSGKIMWRIEWCFPDGSETLLFVDECVVEDCKLYDIVDKYLQPAEKCNIPGAAKLAYYQARGISALQLLLKAEGIKQCRDRTLPLNINDTLRESLRDKTVVEFPTIYVVFKDQLDQFNVADSDEDMEAEMRHYKRFIDESQNHSERSIKVENIESRLDKMNLEQISHGNTAHSDIRQDGSFNFLFSDETFLNDLSESDEELTVLKKRKSEPGTSGIDKNDVSAS